MKKFDLKKIKIAIIGMGYVGLPLSVEFGKKFKTVGFDINKKRIEELNRGEDLTLELTSKEIKFAKHISFSSDIKSLGDANVYIVTVPTPIDDVNRPDLSPIKKASKLISEYLNKNDIVIYESTVFPGCTEEVCVPILEKYSNLIFNEDFFCGYSPERIVPGDKVNTVTKIKKITSGSSIESAEFINELYEEIIDAGTFPASSIKVAEAAKVIENSQRDLNIAFVNELSIIFEKLDIDSAEVLDAAGTKWNFLPFKPGIVGGHCIGVDPYYLTHKAEQEGYHPQVILAGRKINDSMAQYIAKNIVKRMVKNDIDISNAVIGMFGITFKENCPDIRNSKVLDIIYELNSWGINVVVNDPWADEEEVKAIYGLDLEEINPDNQVDSLIVAVGHNQFRDMKPKYLKSLCKKPNPVIGDIKSIYNKKDLLELGFNVYRL